MDIQPLHGCSFVGVLIQASVINPSCGLKHYGSVVPIHTWASSPQQNTTPVSLSLISYPYAGSGFIPTSPSFLIEFLLGIVDVLSHKQFLIGVIQVYTHLREPKLNLIHTPRIIQEVLTLTNHKKIPLHSCLRVKGSCCDFLNAEYWQNVGRVLVSSSGLTGGSTFSATKYKVVRSTSNPQNWRRKISICCSNRQVCGILLW